MSRLHAIVHGRVQGVSFRDFTAKAANGLRLNGWVKNRKDKTVEVVAEGSHIVLIGFLEALKKGPPTAQVGRVDAKWEKEQGEKGFSVK